MSRSLDGGPQLQPVGLAPAVDSDNTDSNGVYRSSLTRVLWSSRTRATGAIDPEVWVEDASGGAAQAAANWQRDAIEFKTVAANYTNLLTARTAVPFPVIGRVDVAFEVVITEPTSGNYVDYSFRLGVVNPEVLGAAVTAYLTWAYDSAGTVSRSITYSVYGGTPIVVPQATWSIDPFDGTGRSRATFAPSRLISTGVYGVPVQFLITQEHNAARIRFAFWWRRQWVYVHEASGGLPTARITSARPRITGISGASFSAPGAAKPACWIMNVSVSTTGPAEPWRRVLSFTNASVNSGVSGTPALILAVRYQVATAGPVQVVTPGGYVQPLAVTLFNSGATTITWRALRRATVTGGTWALLTSALSLLQTNATATTSGGDEVASGFLGAGLGTTVKLTDLLPLTENVAVADTLVFTAVTASGTTCATLLAFQYAESS